MAKVGNSIWTYSERKKVYDDVEAKVYNYFDDLYVDGDKELVEFSNGLIYREGQHNYALDIIDAIRNNKILLIQAGVGIGKSYGYLIPVFYSIDGTKNSKNIKFDKVVVATSNIALQHQLMNDIDKISNMLDISVNAVIAKGINNYACIKRIEKNINSRHTFKDRREVLTGILKEIEEKNSSDRIDLRDISENIWDSIKLRSRGYCSGCIYSKECSFAKTEEQIKKSDIIITNHANYISNSSNWDIDGVVIDEAHKFNENLICTLETEIRLNTIYSKMDTLYSLINYTISDDGINLEDMLIYLNGVKEKIRDLFKSIKRSAISSFNKTNYNNNSVVDGNRLSFNFSREILDNVMIVIKDLNVILDKINKLEIDYNNKKEVEQRAGLRKYFIDLKNTFEDMLKGREKENIYWVSFLNEISINISYIPKDRSDIINNLFGKDIPVVFTSATMVGKDGSYDYFCEKSGIDKLARNIEFAEVQHSPYDYENNALFYYDKNIAVPNDHDNNVRDLALKISELIKITNGKALILFTSKKRMNEVYELMMKMEEFPFKVLLQTDGNATTVKNEFEADVDSCLFATGTFWEGIDVKGKSLSNLIITHLPFDNVDAINKYEAGKYVDKYEKMNQVYIPEMLFKMEQAIGRLIRNDTDTGIVCCLDSRMENYMDGIIEISPIKNITTDIKKVYEFSDNKINGKTNVYSRIK